MASKKWKKRLKKLSKNISKVLKVAAPVAAFAIPGVGGLEAGAALAGGGAALTPGDRKKKFKSLKKSAVAVGVGFGAAQAVGLISGQGFGAGGFSSLSKIGSDIFGGGGGALPNGKGGGSSGLEEAFIDDQRAAPGDPSALGALGGAFLGSTFSGAETSQTSNPNEAGERGGGPFGGPVAEMFGTGEGESKGINPLWIVGGGLALIMLSKKKAG